MLSRTLVRMFIASTENAAPFDTFAGPPKETLKKDYAGESGLNWNAIK